MTARSLLGILSGVVLIALAALEIVRWRKILRDESSVGLAWASARVPLEDLVREFPRSEGNEAAVRLEGNLSAMGMLTPPQFTTLAEEQAWKASHRSVVDAAEVESSIGEVWDYVENELRRGDDLIAEVPPGVECVLTVLGDGLSRLRRDLSTGALPAWKSDISLPENDDQMHADDLRRVSELLLADALHSWRCGLREAALQDLEASSRIARALWTRPSVSQRFDSILISNRVAAAVRKIDLGRLAWMDRLMETDYRRGFVAAYAVQSVRGSSYSVVYFPPAMRLKTRDWLRLWIVRQSKFGSAARDALKIEAAWASRVHKATPCDYDSAAADRFWDQTAARFDPLAQVFAWPPNVHWETVFLRHMLEIELTDRVLKARQGSGVPCEGFECESEACPTARWSCSQSGRVVAVAFEGSPPQSNMDKFDFPLSQSWHLN